jgi:uncharacterized protein YyaL (SSP411 family)
MALGGLYDQVGGGFARYATDSNWRIPHFEKMLYDNGLLASAYANAYQVTGDSFYRKIAAETLGFIEQSLSAPEGGYYSSLNADTEDGEGAYYAWRKKDFLRITGGNEIIADYFHVTEAGNWKPSANILYADKTPGEFAAAHHTDPASFAASVTTIKSALLAARGKRVSPTVDTKIITSWNGIILKAYADAYAATGDDAYLIKARQLAAFIEKRVITRQAGLLRNITEGKTSGFLDDYAWTLAGLIRLYEISFDTHWISLARQLSDYTVKEFYNPFTGLFFYSGKKGELVVRQTEVTDDAIPSSNAVLAKSLYSLGIIFDDSSYTGKSIRMYQAVAARAKRNPRYYLSWCSFAGFLSAKKYEVVITGKAALEKNRELQKSYLPNCIVMGSTQEESLPLLANKFFRDKTLIYICTDKVCKRPEEEPAKALQQIIAGKR